MGKIVLLAVDPARNRVLIEHVSSHEANATLPALLSVARAAINAGDLDLVWVLHKGQRTLMLVDDLGATHALGYPLALNPQATEIYHAARRARGNDWDGPPYIHGDAVLFEDLDME